MENKKLKIAFLSLYSGQMYRGVETYVHELANKLSELGHDVTVIQSGPKHDNSKYNVKFVSATIDWKNKSNSPILFNYWPLPVKKFTSAALKKLDKDTDIVIPTNGQWQTILSKIWCLKNKAKMVVSGQSGPGIDDRINVMCFPDRFVALSGKALRKAKSDNPFVKSVYIPNGVDIKLFKPSGDRIKHSLKKPVILCVGALVGQKRIELVIKAVSKIKEVSLLIVGDGILKEELKKLASILIPGRHEFLNVKHSDMPKVYRSADIFTLVPENSESFGIVYVEALASNLPVVAIDDSIRRDIIGDNGSFIKDPTDIEEYANELRKVLNKKWGNKPRLQGEMFDWSEIANKYEKLFLGLVN